jgi:hypothetical protein
VTKYTQTPRGLAAALCLGLSAVAVDAAARPAQGQAAPIAQPPAQPTTTRPPGAAAQTPGPRRGTLPQGFSVVLVLGDLQGSATPDDLPPAARRALTDLKDFLPFKSFKLLDAAWVMCCASDPRTEQLAHARVIPSPRRLGDVVTQLRGPEERTYELKLAASQSEPSRVFVEFTLRNLDLESPNELASTTAAIDRQVMMSRTADEIAKLEVELAEARKKYNSGHPEVRKLETELNAARRRAEITGRRSSGSGRGGSLGRTMIDTTFTMDVGETVVVGTSRLRGGSQALITMLTAVPPRPK